MNWKKENMRGMKGKTAIVTGANSGLGFETAKALAQRGCKVVLGCRSIEKGRNAQEKIEKELKESEVFLMKLDLADIESIRSFARKYRKKFEKLDLMINNAGVMHIPFRKTDFDFEYQFGVNHLGHFLLNSQLIDMIKETENSRVVSVSSLLHKRAELNFDKLNDRNFYDKNTAYADSKMANLLYAKLLNHKFYEKDIDSKAFAVHPGYASTNLQLRAAGSTGGKIKLLFTKVLNKLIAQSAKNGALPTLYACSEQLEGGEFIGPSGFKQLRGSPTEVEPDPIAEDRNLQKKLWNYSENQLEINYEV